MVVFPEPFGPWGSKLIWLKIGLSTNFCRPKNHDRSWSGFRFNDDVGQR